MARKSHMHKISGGTKTKAAVFSEFDQQWTPGWDKEMSNGQGMIRSRKRKNMGQKETPIGPGKLTKK